MIGNDDHPLPICRWSDGGNYLLFSMLPGDWPHYNATPDYYYGKVHYSGSLRARLTVRL